MNLVHFGGLVQTASERKHRKGKYPRTRVHRRVESPPKDGVGWRPPEPRSTTVFPPHWTLVATSTSHTVATTQLAIFLFVIMLIVLLDASRRQTTSLPSCVELGHSSDSFCFRHGAHLGLWDVGLLGQRTDHANRNCLSDWLRQSPVR